MKVSIPPPWSRQLSFSVLFLLTALAALAAVALGQDGGFDLKNYHHYNAWALLAGRADFDVALAQRQTWFNPLLDLHYYLLLEAFGPRWGSALVAATQGLAFWLVFDIIGRVLVVQAPQLPRTDRLTLALAVVAVAACGPISYVNLGASRGDLSAAILVLASLRSLLALPACPGRRVPVSGLLAAGLLMGLGCGLKLTVACYGLGALLALLVLDWGPVEQRLRAACCFGLGGGAGLVAAAGPWMLSLWRRYENPIFPYANHLFRSPFAPPLSYSEERFRPESWMDALSLPLQFATGGELAWEFAFRDPRFALVYLLLVAALLKALWRLARSGSVAAPPGPQARASLLPSAQLLIGFAVASYICWQQVFCVYRYLAPLELLAPVLMVALLFSLLQREMLVLLASAGLFAIAVVGLQLPAVERLTWSDDIFAVSIPAIDDTEAGVVVFAGDDATAYLASFLPDRYRLVRIAGNFAAFDDNTGMHDRMRAAIADSHGPAYFLKGPYEIDHAALHHFGLSVVEGSCEEVASRVDGGLALCRLRRDGS